MLLGALHLHSTYSDGEFSLAELREVLVEAGCRFACVTDHAEAFDAAKLAAYRRDCEQRSDSRFVIIPSLEYRCENRMHILGYGSTEPIDSTDPEAVVTAIRRNGGIAVIAHPYDEAFGAIEGLEPLPDGIEVWNSKYDGQYAPRPATFALLSRLQQRRPEMHAFYGIDLHWRHQFRSLFVEAACETMEATEIMKALRRGDYCGVKSGMRLRADGVVASDVMARFQTVHARSARMRRWAGVVKSLVERVAAFVPPPVRRYVNRVIG